MPARYVLAAAAASSSVSVPVPVRAETMLTSYYAAPAPHIAAHRHLPKGTRLVVTNPRNGRSVQVVIGDRGPYVGGRSLDVSTECARRLGFTRSGVARLDVRILRR